MSHVTYERVMLHMNEKHCQYMSQSHGHIGGRGYGVATISRLLKIIRLFCRISSLLQGSFAKETYIFKERTNRSHPIVSI